jgi:hypothetical protein
MAETIAAAIKQFQDRTGNLVVAITFDDYGYNNGQPVAPPAEGIGITFAEPARTTPERSANMQHRTPEWAVSCAQDWLTVAQRSGDAQAIAKARARPCERTGGAQSSPATRPASPRSRQRGPLFPGITPEPPSQGVGGQIAAPMPSYALPAHPTSTAFLPKLTH